MSVNTVLTAALAAVLLLVAAPATAQLTPECPAADPEDGRTIELRVLDTLLRVQVKTDTARSGEGSRLDARVVGCSDAPAAADVPAGADAEADAPAAPDGLAAFARVLSDLRVGIELTPTEDGRCFRATLDVKGAARDVGAVDEPEALSFQLCGLPTRR